MCMPVWLKEVGARRQECPVVYATKECRTETNGRGRQNPGEEGVAQRWRDIVSPACVLVWCRAGVAPQRARSSRCALHGLLPFMVVGGEGKRAPASQTRAQYAEREQKRNWRWHRSLNSDAISTVSGTPVWRQQRLVKAVEFGRINRSCYANKPARWNSGELVNNGGERVVVESAVVDAAMARITPNAAQLQQTSGIATSSANCPNSRSTVKIVYCRRVTP